MAPMATRTYGDGCAIAAGLDLIGERWALLVVRELLLGPKRYTDLQRGLPNASPNVLSERLRELERDGVVRRRKLPPPAGSRVYELTAWGRELEGIVVALGHWATRSGSPPRDAPVGVDSVIIALRSRFNSGAAEGLHARYELRLGEDRFQIVVADEGIEVARGDHDQADATIEADPATLAAVLWGEGSLTDARRAGAVVIEGDATAARRFFRLFPVPEPVAVSAD
jgi:DNA-binding HxlR family transcriptional regulator/putative sterol carrier protein